MLKSFTYKFNEGPFNTIKELESNWNHGNCRRAVQLYFYETNRVFLSPKQILCPESFNETGWFINKYDEDFHFKNLDEGDIIYAERIRNKNNELVNKSLATFKTRGEYLISLHTALFISDEKIWHASSISNGSCEWSIQDFLFYYKPVAAKRL